jgi:hypothetical protein
MIMMHIPGSNHQTCIEIDLQLIITVHFAGLRAYVDILLVLLRMLKGKIQTYTHTKLIPV